MKFKYDANYFYNQRVRDVERAERFIIENYFQNEIEKISNPFYRYKANNYLRHTNVNNEDIDWIKEERKEGRAKPREKGKYELQWENEYRNRYLSVKDKNEYNKYRTMFTQYLVLIPMLVLMCVIYPDYTGFWFAVGAIFGVVTGCFYITTEDFRAGVLRQAQMKKDNILKPLLTDEQLYEIVKYELERVKMR